MTRTTGARDDHESARPSPSSMPTAGDAASHAAGDAARLVVGDTAEPRAERPAPTFVMGNIAAAEGALAVGCRFFAGYPITPSSEIMTTMARRLPELGGVFAQMEDEIASISAVIGASWTGAKAMTATSGPGFSLMMEGFGYAAFTETPLVVVNVQRAGPATGQATHIGAGDVLQVKFGSHGDILPIALSPWSVQEMYDLSIRAFNLAERFRVPTYLMSDEGVGHLRESVVYHHDFEAMERVRGTAEDTPFDTEAPDGVPPMPVFGDGARLLVTGSTHDGKGYRRIDHPDVHDRLVRRLHDKILSHRDEVVRVEAYHLEDADLAVVAYGFVARAAWAAVRRLRARGRRVGLLRLQTLWPFPDEEIRGLGGQVKRILFPELNLGQLRMVAQAATPTEVVGLSQVDGRPITPATLMERLEALA